VSRVCTIISHSHFPPMEIASHRPSIHALADVPNITYEKRGRRGKGGGRREDGEGKGERGGREGSGETRIVILITATLSCIVGCPDRQYSKATFIVVLKKTITLLALNAA
jgi:hypothetical protein